MAVFDKWIPTGCAERALGMAAPFMEDKPGFPGDYISRAVQADLGIEALYLAWEITRLAGNKLEESRERSLILLLLALQLNRSEGSTRLPLAEKSHLENLLDVFQATAREKEAIADLLAEATAVCQKEKSSSLEAVFGSRGDYRPLIIDHHCLYIQKLHLLERRVGKMLRERMSIFTYANWPPEAVNAALEEVFNNPPTGKTGEIAADRDQQEALRRSLQGNLTVISGMPGSGKTSIVADLLRVLARLGDPPLESIALAAPTGKAADRMQQSIARHLAAIPARGEIDTRLAVVLPPSTTLHRLLGYSPGRERFQHDENNPLSEKLVIVDESSMIDLAMIDRLLRALHPEAGVIFLGDADQLPPIESGAVLRDLCRSELSKEQERRAVLHKSYRAREEESQGRAILNAAAAIKAAHLPTGSGLAEMLPPLTKTAELQFSGVELLVPADGSEIEAFFARWLELIHDGLPDGGNIFSNPLPAGPSGFERETAETMRHLFDHFERFRILCVTRVSAGGTGSEVVNAWFHRRWAEWLRHRGIAESAAAFLIGEPLLVTRNDYNLHLYNGDSGLVLPVAIKEPGGELRQPFEMMAVFPRGDSFVAYPLEALCGRIEPAWATTVHKAQGSEYDNVAILLPRLAVRPLTRELLYTAVTRAKKAVVIIGSREILERGTRHSIERASGLADLLRC